MQPAGGVNRGHGLAEAAKELDQQSIGERLLAPGEQSLEVDAVDPFQDDERGGVIAEGLLQPGDPRMIESRQQPSLALQPLPRPGLDEHPLAGRVVGRLEATGRDRVRRLQAIAAGEHAPDLRRDVAPASPIDRTAGRRHGGLYSSVFAGMV